MILLDLLVTVIIYCAVPTIYRLVKKQAMDNKNAKIFAIVNSSIVWLILLVVYLALELDIIPNMAAAAIWGFVSYRILIHIPKEKPEKAKAESAQPSQSSSAHYHNYFANLFDLADQTVTERFGSTGFKIWRLELIMYALYKTRLILLSEWAQKHPEETDLDAISNAYADQSYAALKHYAFSHNLIEANLLQDFYQSRLDAYERIYSKASESGSHYTALSFLGEALHWFLFHGESCFPLDSNCPARPYDDYFTPVKDYPDAFVNNILNLYDAFELCFIGHASEHISFLLSFISECISASYINSPLEADNNTEINPVSTLSEDLSNDTFIVVFCIVSIVVFAALIVMVKLLI